MRRASSLVAVLTLAALGLAASAPARARPGTNYPFPPATAAERNQTRPLVSVALGALRDGDFGAICGVMSQRWLTADFGSRDRCRRLAASHPTRPCKSCDYTESFMGSGFDVSNPNVVASCGCGSSFRVADEEPSCGAPA